MSSAYEKFRNSLSLNLCSVLPDAETMKSVLKMVDLSAAAFDMAEKPVSIIPATGVPEVLKCYIASKAIANASKGTLTQYHCKLSHFFKTVNKSYADITANDVRVYLFNFKKDRNSSDRYMESIRITINGFFQWLVDNEYIMRNPCAKVEKIRFLEKKREPFTTLNLEELRMNCKTIRDKAILDFLFSTGCRVAECADMMIDDIDIETNTAHVRHGKGNKERTVFFNDEARVALKKYLSSRKGNSPALFASSKYPYEQLKPHAIEAVIKGIGKRAGIHAYPHKLRHTFATVSLQNGMPLETIQSLLGHSNPQTTLIYAKQDETQAHIAHRRIFC